MFAGQFGKLQEQYTEAFGTIQEQKQLITQLEEDLRSVNALSVMFRGDAEVMMMTSFSFTTVYDMYMSQFCVYCSKTMLIVLTF